MNMFAMHVMIITLKYVGFNSKNHIELIAPKYLAVAPVSHNYG